MSGGGRRNGEFAFLAGGVASGREKNAVINLIMERGERFSWRKRGRSFLYAFRGIGMLLRDEHNSRIHLVAGMCAVALGRGLGLERWEWVAVTGCIAAVMAAEAFNSAIEAVADRFGVERHPLIGKGKDVAAAGVLITALGALIIGLIVFLGKLTERLGLG